MCITCTVLDFGRLGAKSSDSYYNPVLIMNYQWMSDRRREYLTKLHVRRVSGKVRFRRGGGKGEKEEVFADVPTDVELLDTETW